MRLFMALLASFPLVAFSASPELIKQTLEAQPSCATFVRVAGEKLILGFGHYWELGANTRTHMPHPIVMVDMEDASRSVKVMGTDTSIDALGYQDRIFVLTFEGLEERKADTMELIAVHATHNENRTLEYKEHPARMVRFNDKIFIAHNRLGVTVFDLNARGVTQRIPLAVFQRPLESMATGIALDKDKLIVLMDNFHLNNANQKPPFRGLIFIDAKTGRIERQLEGTDGGTDSLTIDGTHLLVSYLGMPIWKYRLQDLQGTKMPRPVSVVWKFGMAGHPTGQAYMDEKYLHTCFMKTPESPEDPQRAYRMPVSLDRAALKL